MWYELERYLKVLISSGISWKFGSATFEVAGFRVFCIHCISFISSSTLQFGDSKSSDSQILSSNQAKVLGTIHYTIRY